MAEELDSDFSLAAYDYDLPETSIAKYPPEIPGSSRLLVMNRFPPAGEEGCRPAIMDAAFGDIADFLPPESLIVANNSKVLPARIMASRPGGGKLEFLLLTPLPLLLGEAESQAGMKSARVQCLLRPASRIGIGAEIRLGPDLEAKVLAKSAYGRCEVCLCWSGDLESIFKKIGRLPLPPYIKREPEQADQNRYQTIYAKKTGSAAAPTAGLHFTPEIREGLLAQGHEWREATLYVGYGTFSPVRHQDIRQHEMHAEYVEISPELANAVNEAIRQKRPIVAVGTTSLRALEGVHARFGEIRPFSGWTDIFMYPGKKFMVANCLLTNFHLPQSTLLMLVAAFAGRKRILNAYAHALERGYRFFSYGDAMLIR